MLDADGIFPDETAILMSIVARDPDGQPTEPTEEGYKIFETWVRTTYGDDVWKRYHSEWGTPYE